METATIIERVNPFRPIYELCNKGDSKYKLKNLPKFPRLIDIELTNTCNFKCLMCIYGISAHDRKTGFMSDETLYKILQEIDTYKTPLRFIGWGEQMLHPKFLDFFSEIKNKGYICHLGTNGSLLNKDIMSELIDMQFDSIKFSFQGVDRETFLEMRNIDFYDKLIETIKLFYNKRGSKKLPFIHASTTITYESIEQVNTFKKKLQPITDLVTAGRTLLEHIDIDKAKLSKKEYKLLKMLKQKESVIKKHQECPEVFDKLTINWDGTVTACCWDYNNLMLVGDLNKNSLSEIWNSKKLNTYRKLLAEKMHDKIPLCKMCYDPLSLQNPGQQGL